MQLVIVFVFLNIVEYSCFEDIAIPDTTAETYPFLAFVKGTESCTGILIKAEYVIAPASCVCGISQVTVYLGYEKCSYFMDSEDESGGQVFTSDHIIKHEDYIKINTHRHLNNIAIIKLPHACELTPKVQPGKFVTKEESLLLEGKIVHVTGWNTASNTNMKEAHVRFRTRDTCRFIYGEKFFHSQESCVRWLDSDSLNLPGNPVTIDGEIIGFQTVAPPCIRNHECTRNDVILNIVPYIDWIAHRTDTTIEDLTGIGKHHQHVANKILEIYHIIEEVKTEHHASQAHSDETIHELKEVISDHHKEGNDYHIQLDEQIRGIKTEMSHHGTIHDEHILKLEEEIGDTRNVITNGLIAEKTFSDELGKVIGYLTTKISSHEHGLQNMVHIIDHMKHQIDSNIIYLKDVTVHLQQKLQDLWSKLHFLEHQDKCPTCVNELQEHIYGNLHNFTTSLQHRIDYAQNDFNHLFRLVNELKAKEHDDYDLFNTIFHTKDLEFKKVCDRLDLMEVIIDESRARFDHQVIVESRHFQTSLDDQEKLGERINQCCTNNFYSGRYK